jgi:DNA-directed RNA polymerase III subunit RPC7
MSRFSKGKRLPGAELTWDADPGGQPDTAPTPLYPVGPLFKLGNPALLKSLELVSASRLRYGP